MSAVRIGVAVFLFALIGLLVYVTLFDQSGESRERAAKPVVRAALVAILDGRDDLPVESLVVGSEIAADRFDFRGAVKSETTSLPLYGVVSLTCDELRRDPACWELVVLERDGQPWPLVAIPMEDVPSAEPEAASEAGESSFDETVTGSESFLFDERLTPESDVEILSDVGARDDEEPDASASSGNAVEEPLFRVTAEIVNGRAGPGTEHEVIAWISPERRLIELEAGEEWGRFRYLDPNEDDSEEFWVWLGLVSEAPTEP